MPIKRKLSSENAPEDRPNINGIKKELKRYNGVVTRRQAKINRRKKDLGTLGSKEKDPIDLPSLDEFHTWNAIKHLFEPSKKIDPAMRNFTKPRGKPASGTSSSIPTPTFGNILAARNTKRPSNPP